MAPVVSAILALATYPVYTAVIGVPALGVADLVASWLIFLSILARLGLGEALLRYWPASSEAGEYPLRRKIQRMVFAASVSVAGLVVMASSVLAPYVTSTGSRPDHTIVWIAAAGLLIYCNLDVAMTVLRAMGDHRRFRLAALANVALTVALTLALVLVLDLGVYGYLAGNYAASGLVLLGLWAADWRRTHGSSDSEELDSDDVGPLRRELLSFGVPVMVSEAAIFGFNLVDRTALAALAPGSGDEAGFALGVFSSATKLAVGMILAARAFQLAFPPVAYAISSANAQHVFTQTVRLYVLVASAAVVAMSLAGPWTVHLLVQAPPGAMDPRPAILEVFPLVLVAWGLWGLVPVMTAAAGRVGATWLTLLPAALALVANVLLILWLVPSHGATGAACSLIAAYLVLLVVSGFGVRSRFPIALERGRILTIVITCIAAVGCVNALGPNDNLLTWPSAATRLAVLILMITLLARLGLTPKERTDLRAWGTTQLRLAGS